jgi:hypothetical protein
MNPSDPIQPMDVVVDSRIVERDRSHLTEAEQSLLKELLRPGADIDATISTDMPADKLWHTLDACIRGMAILETRILRIRPIIGRIIQAFEDKPSLYKELGFETFSDFMEKGVEKLGLCRTTAYQAKLVANKWPQVGPDRYAGSLGPKKIDVLSKFTHGRAPGAEAWLQTAESMTVEQLKQYVSQRGFIEPGEADWGEVRITTNKARAAFIEEFFADGRVHSIVGSKNRDRVLEALIQENKWIEEYEEQDRRK